MIGSDSKQIVGMIVVPAEAADDADQALHDAHNDMGGMLKLWKQLFRGVEATLVE